MGTVKEEESVEVTRGLKEILKRVNAGKDEIEELAKTQCGKRKRKTTS